MFEKLITILPGMKISKAFIYFSLLLSALYVIQWWLLFYYFTNVPEYLPNTDIKTAGLLLAITILPTIYFFVKLLTKEQPSITLLQLTISGILLAIVTEVLFQIVRLSVSSMQFNEKIIEGVNAVLFAAVIIGIISFMTAFQVKHPRSVWNTVFWILFFGLIYLLKQYTRVLQ